MVFFVKNIFKKVYAVSIVSVLTIIDLLKIFFFSSFKAFLRIKKIRDKYAGSECYLFGNGPSLSSFLEDNLSSLKGKNVFAVNFFCNTKYFRKIKPKFYMVIDSLFFSEVQESNVHQNFEMFRNSMESVDWHMYVFSPIQFQNTDLIKSIKNKNIHWIWINTTPLDGLKFIRHSMFNLDLGMPFPQTVINAAIFITIRLNFSKVHLYGTEQSWLKGMYVDTTNRVVTELDHFYKAKIDIKAPSLSNLLLTQYKVFLGHEKLQDYAISSNVTILNHVGESYIDSYKKV